MFEKHRAKKAAKDYPKALQRWQAERDECAHLLEVARGYRGITTSDVSLKPGEALLATLTHASLIEDRQSRGHWESRSSGWSFPVASVGGRSVRYHVGVSRGHYISGQPVPSAIDQGTVLITNQRVIFQGTRQTRECRFDHLLGYQHDDRSGTTVLSVSNRQRPVRLQYGAAVAGWFDFRLSLALAHYHGQVPVLVAELEAHLAEIDTRRPLPPISCSTPALATSATGPFVPSPEARAEKQPQSDLGQPPPDGAPPVGRASTDGGRASVRGTYAQVLQSGIESITAVMLRQPDRVTMGIPGGDPQFQAWAAELVAAIQSYRAQLFAIPDPAGAEAANERFLSTLTEFSDWVSRGQRAGMESDVGGFRAWEGERPEALQRLSLGIDALGPALS